MDHEEAPGLNGELVANVRKRLPASIHIAQGPGQQPLPSIFGSPCVQGIVPGSLDTAYLSELEALIDQVLQNSEPEVVSRIFVLPSGISQTCDQSVVFHPYQRGMDRVPCKKDRKAIESGSSPWCGSLASIVGLNECVIKSVGDLPRFRPESPLCGRTRGTFLLVKNKKNQLIISPLFCFFLRKRDDSSFLDGNEMRFFF